MSVNNDIPKHEIFKRAALLAENHAGGVKGLVNRRRETLELGRCINSNGIAVEEIEEGSGVSRSAIRSWVTYARLIDQVVALAPEDGGLQVEPILTQRLEDFIKKAEAVLRLSRFSRAVRGAGYQVFQPQELWEVGAKRLHTRADVLDRCFRDCREELISRLR